MIPAGVSTAPRRVLIVDDHPVVRQGIKLMIEAEPDLTICGEAQTEQQARKLVRELRPDALLVDLSLSEGDGFNVVRDVHAHFPEIRVLVLSMHDEAIYAERLLAEGASGYIMKQAATDQLVTALRTVLRGERFVSDTLKRSLETRREVEGAPSSRLSSRELQVISLIGQGLGTREIADNLSLSVKTVETHRLTIKRKLALDTNAQLVQYAIKWHGTPAG
ncbi:MAG: response regulator transcription factor [Proteobacteria bacterium]|jgi:DNA-binding NarL/FixJ family response regulator|nr:response regulator transcription factor [Pseudomonadota bacterium]MBK9250690.1 response regulator transcription factor [Pseudomonadota bacterium]MCC6632854.1 response regulator transcription factor [Gammaproteobacteria bacterium]